MIVDVTKNGVDIAEERELMTRARECFENFREGSEPLTGWARLPYEFDESCRPGDQHRTSCQICVSLFHTIYSFSIISRLISRL